MENHGKLRVAMDNIMIYPSYFMKSRVGRLVFTLKYHLELYEKLGAKHENIQGRKRPLESIENNINSADLVGQTDLQRGRRQCRRLFSPQQKVFASYTST